jgi:hypothetical protein
MITVECRHTHLHKGYCPKCVIEALRREAEEKKMTDEERYAILRRLADCPIPSGCLADWRDTRHYEIQCTDTSGFPIEYWWLVPAGYTKTHAHMMIFEADERLGAVLDYAVAYPDDVSLLLDRVRELEEQLSEARKRIAELEAICAVK